MADYTIAVTFGGTTANDGTGDQLRTHITNMNANWAAWNSVVTWDSTTKAATFAGAIKTTNTTASTSTTTGSIIAGGGLGVAGALNVGTYLGVGVVANSGFAAVLKHTTGHIRFENGAEIAAMSLEAAGDVSLYVHDGAALQVFKVLYGTGAGTLAASFGATNTFPRPISVTNTTASTSTTTGALVVAGGGGFAKAIVAGGGMYLGGTAAANLLDDYEEGTFTPTVTAATGSGATYTFNRGRYTKVGNKVFFEIYMALTGKGTLSGDLSIAGLPFSTDLSPAYYSPINLAGIGFNITAGYTPTAIIIGTTTLRLNLWDGTGGMSTLQASEIGTNFAPQISGFYQTTA